MTHQGISQKFRSREHTTVLSLRVSVLSLGLIRYELQQRVLDLLPRKTPSDVLMGVVTLEFGSLSLVQI